VRWLRIGWWWVLDWLYAARWQLRSLGPTTADDYRSGDRQPVVVLPGVYETWHFMRPLMDALHDRGHPVHVVTALRHNLLPVPESAAVLVEMLEREGLEDVLVVAHSKGGLIGKYAMTELDVDAGRIDRMVAIATPFAGSAWARYVPAGNLRMFRAVDPVIVGLLRAEQANARITSVSGVFDPLVPDGSELPGATNVTLPVGGHFRILDDPRTARAVLDALDD
jgi:pimeloyl-ACP methyl ester carboxylesterase